MLAWSTLYSLFLIVDVLANVSQFSSSQNGLTVSLVKIAARGKRSSPDGPVEAEMSDSVRLKSIKTGVSDAHMTLTADVLILQF